jgi:hypothetical protein
MANVWTGEWKMKPNEGRVCTDGDVAEVLEGFEEEMLASIRRGREVAKRPKAEVVEFPPKLSEQELIRRQLIIDQAWERVLEQRRELERIAERSCHRGPLDSDSNL